MDVSQKALFISNWIKDYVNSMPKKAKSLVIGVSGGIDSSVSSTLSAMTGLRTIVLSMDKTIVLKPVIALNVLDTEESIPPETPITNDLAFFGILLT